MFKNLGKIVDEIRAKQPLVFHITNTVTINDCANITLAVGASPLMSFCEEEQEEILSFASALVINIGTMDKNMREIVIKAGEKANKLGKPVILDPVGVGATSIRKQLVEELLQKVKFAVIKGNTAEIKAIYGMKNTTNRGVDSIEELENSEEIAKTLAVKYKTVIAITGKQDIISDGNRVIKINNGTAALGKITGTGCMTASLIGSACGAVDDYLLGAAAAVAMMGIAGEMAENVGNGTMKVKLLDNICTMTGNELNSKLKLG